MDVTNIVDIENIASLSTINNEKSNRFNNELLQGLGISLNTKIELPTNQEDIHLHVEYVHVNLDFKNSNQFDDINDINILQNGFVSKFYSFFNISKCQISIPLNL